LKTTTAHVLHLSTIKDNSMKTHASNDPSQSVVVAAIDFMQQSENVLQTAAKLASTANGELHVVHVIPHDAAGSLRGEGALRFSNLADEVRGKLEQLAAELPVAVKRIVLHVRLGSADVEVAQLASDLGADLVVVGTHGHTGLERLLLGSVGASLIRNAPCPVLVCRPKSVRQWEQILPPCADCRAVQQSTGRKTLWCERHAQHHPRAHTYSELPAGFGLGSQTFR
jgi:nucleotide-binding universal stress UspA family protein